MYVIYKTVGGFTYYARINRFERKIYWEGLIDNATKFEDKQSAIRQINYHSLDQEQIKKI